MGLGERSTRVLGVNIPIIERNRGMVDALIRKCFLFCASHTGSQKEARDRDC